jgi:methionyl-tRNA formyltransferase
VTTLRAVFFGTPEFAVPSLSAMLDAGAEVPLVVTQPDRPSGRHATPRPSPIAMMAQARGIAVAKPERLRGNVEILERIRQIAPDAGVVVAYGMLLPNALLDVPRLSFVNVHASLLPKYRGASPVQAAILAGDSETGVVTMRIVEELDAGPIYLERRVPIGEGEDAGSLSRRLAAAGALVLIETLRGLEAGTLQARPQTGEPSFCRPIRREQGEVDWALPAAALERRLRAYTPWPGLHTFLGNERVKIVGAGIGPGGRRERPGTFWSEGGKLLAAAGEGSSLELRMLQRAGRRPVSGADFALGAKLPGCFGPAINTPGS